jgi:hypothetical protein
MPSMLMPTLGQSKLQKYIEKNSSSSWGGWIQPLSYNLDSISLKIGTN